MTQTKTQEYLKKALNFDKEYLESCGYKINDRKFSDIKPLFSEDYKREAFCYPNDSVVYSGAEHTEDLKLPNITILPNLVTRTGHLVMGSTFGHQHTQKQRGDKRRFQEIYEFHGYGGMLLRNRKEATLYILKPQEKVLVGTDDNMTLINLSASPLKTLDYANPKMNSANKDLEKEIGSLLIARSFKDGPKEEYFDFQVNEEYLLKELLDYEIRRSGELKSSLGEELYEKLEESFYVFNRAGIELRFGGNIPEDLDELNQPLLNLALEQNRTLLDCLEI